eukprot:g5555.t1
MAGRGYNFCSDEAHGHSADKLVRRSDCAACSPHLMCTDEAHGHSADESVWRRDCAACSPHLMCTDEAHGHSADKSVRRKDCAACSPRLMCSVEAHGHSADKSVRRSHCGACSPQFFCSNEAHGHSADKSVRRSDCAACSPHLMCTDEAHGHSADESVWRRDCPGCSDAFCEHDSREMDCITCGGERAVQTAAQKAFAAVAQSGVSKAEYERRVRAGVDQSVTTIDAELSRLRELDLLNRAIIYVGVSDNLRKTVEPLAALTSSTTTKTNFTKEELEENYNYHVITLVDESWSDLTGNAIEAEVQKIYTTRAKDPENQDLSVTNLGWTKIGAGGLTTGRGVIVYLVVVEDVVGNPDVLIPNHLKIHGEHHATALDGLRFLTQEASSSSSSSSAMEQEVTLSLAASCVEEHTNRRKFYALAVRGSHLFRTWGRTSDGAPTKTVTAYASPAQAHAMALKKTRNLISPTNGLYILDKFEFVDESKRKEIASLAEKNAAAAASLADSLGNGRNIVGKSEIEKLGKDSIRRILFLRYWQQRWHQQG